MIHHGDCRDILPTLEAGSVDAVVTDPPYHLTTGKRGGAGEASVNPDSAGRSMVTTGFMGKKWDGGDVAFRPETWAAVLRVMKPGAYLLAFGGTRTYHRLACAIEDGGFEIRDQLAWVYGSGFPKGTDKAKIPAEWQGWNTALKPAWEPIVLARKPMIGTLAENLQAHGCGALNVDGCRIATNGETITCIQGGKNGGGFNIGSSDGSRSTQFESSPLGRWPANLMHDGSEEVLEHFPDAPGQQADLTGSEPSRPALNVYGDFPAPRVALARGDAGSAARFFYCPKADREDREHGMDGVEKKPLLRNHHPTVKPTELMRWLVRLVTPPGGVVLDPFAGSGSTGRAALLERMGFVGIELEDEYAAIARARIAAVDPQSFTLAAQR